MKISVQRGGSCIPGQGWRQDLKPGPLTSAQKSPPNTTLRIKLTISSRPQRVDSQLFETTDESNVYLVEGREPQKSLYSQIEA